MSTVARIDIVLQARPLSDDGMDIDIPQTGDGVYNDPLILLHANINI